MKKYFAMFFIMYIAGLIIGYLATLNINPYVDFSIAVLNLGLSIPGDIVDLVIQYTELKYIFIIIGICCTTKYVYDLIWGDGITF